MSLLYLQSFDGITYTQLKSKGWSENIGLEAGFQAFRTNNGLRLTENNSSTGYVRYSFGQNINTNLVIGWAEKRSYETNSANMFGLGQSSLDAKNNAKNFTIDRDSRHSYNLFRAGNIDIDNHYSYNKNIINYYEVKLTTSDSGSCVVKINSVTVLNFSGDTLYSSSNTDSATWSVPALIAGDLFLDDLYICDGNGSVNNDFLGPIRIETLYPNANGNTNNFTGSDADSTDNYLLVDEETVDDDTTYVEDDTVSNKDLYGYDDLTSSNINSIIGLQVQSYVKLDGAGTKGLTHVARSDTTEGDSSEITVDYTTYKEEKSIYEQDPDASSAWTETTVNAAEFGVKVST